LKTKKIKVFTYIYRVKALQNPLIQSVTASMEEPSGETVDALRIESPGIKDNTDDKRLYVLLVEVLIMLNSGFIKWVAIAFIIGCPVAWYAVHKWLQNFVSRIEMRLFVFVTAGVVVLIITLLTVSFQSWRAARKNPVDSLRYE